MVKVRLGRLAGGLAGCGRRCGTGVIQVAGRFDRLGNRDWSCRR